MSRTQQIVLGYLLGLSFLGFGIYRLFNTEYTELFNGLNWALVLFAFIPVILYQPAALNDGLFYQMLGPGGGLTFAAVAAHIVLIVLVYKIGWGRKE